MLDKAIEHGKEKRERYRDSRRFDRSCRNHGECDYCRCNRTFFDRKRRVAAEMDMEDVDGESDTAGTV